MMPDLHQRVKQYFAEALDLDPSTRAGFVERLRVADPQAASEVESLLAHDAEAEAEGCPAKPPLDAALTVPQTSGHEDLLEQTVGPYTIRRQVGSGTFGTVYLADRSDGQFRQKVALKVLKRGLDTQEILARFQNERQTLASLEKHPHIVTLLDGGRTSDGRPYFAMEYIDGKPIDQYCDDHRLPLRERLRLFLRVCSAVQHAHKNLVIHRDLKPANILVRETANGEGYGVKLLDFGIAKLLSPELAAQTLVPTQLGERPCTPAYASPEQIRGERIDATSDVYSLGVLLYELLSGHRPYHFPGGLRDVERVVCEQEPERPSTKVERTEVVTKSDQDTVTLTPEVISTCRGGTPKQLRRQLAGDLDNIVLMALRKEPERRYQSVLELAHDIERYLNGDPVIARGHPFGYRTGKFVRKHKGKLSAATLVLVALVVGLVAVNHERDRTAQALEAETQARADEATAREHAMTALRTLTGEVVEQQMGRGVQLTEQDRAFLRRILKLYEGFAAVRGEGPEGRAIRAEGYLRVGSLRESLGELKESEAACQEALELWQQLATDFPMVPLYRQELAASHFRLGNVLAKTHRLKAAEAAYKDALALEEQLTTDFPTVPDHRLNLSTTYHNLGYILLSTGQLQEAERCLHNALAHQKQLATDFPAVPLYRQEVVRTYDMLGGLLRATNRAKEAEAAYKKALDFQKQLTADFPTVPQYRQVLARSHHNLGNLLQTTGRAREAEGAYRDALAIYKPLAAAFPIVPPYRQELATCHTNLGVLLRTTGRAREAEDTCREALAIQKSLAVDFPTVPQYRLELARGHTELGNLLQITGRAREAEEAYREALALQKLLATDFPDVPQYRLDRARSHNNLGTLLAATGRVEAAEEAYREALALHKQLAADSPTVPEYQSGLAGTLVNLARLSRDRQEFAQARALLDQARPHCQAALQAGPKNPFYRQTFSEYLTTLAPTLAALGEPAAAAASAEELARLGREPAADAYDAACTLSLCIPAVEKAADLSEAKRKEQARAYADRAMHFLREAIAHGFKDVGHMKKDTDLDPLRSRPDFQQLLRDLEGKK
jgi:serine/threonine protein kinase/tetratricopeptide (TPR) repeat protein